SATNATGIKGGQDVFGNVVYGNYNGIDGGISIRNNRVFNNSNFGINGSSLILGNKAYSNSIGIEFQNGSSFSAVANNVVYANTNVGLLLQNVSSYSGHIDVVNNTVYQVVGDAVSISGFTQNLTLRSNILWVEAGHDVNVASSSQSGLASDYNILYKGTDP